MHYISLITAHNTASFKPAVRATIAIISLDYELPAEVLVGCNWIQEGGTAVSCPLSAGDHIIYLLEQEVEPNSPTLFSPELTFRLYDDADRVIACWSWIANIV